MAWSWVRVSTRTSPKLRNCIEGDTSAARVKTCVTEIVLAAGGELGEIDGEHGKIDFEANGRWARVKFFWGDPHIKRNVIYDLQADHVIDLISGDERDELQLRDP